MLFYTRQKKKLKTSRFHEDSNSKNNRESNNLPDHVMALISDRMPDLKDYIRFGVVCRSWHSIYVDNLHLHRSSQCLPYLMVQPPEQENDHQTRRLYCLRENKIVPNIKLQVPHDEYCRGSSHGWLITLNHNLHDIRLLNPFLSTNNVINLPPLTTFPNNGPGDVFYNESFFFKAVLSASPALNSNYAVMAIYGQFNRLGYWKPGDTTWTHLGFDHWVIDDVIHYNNKFYAISFEGDLFSCDVNHPNPKLERVAPPLQDNYSDKKYLVVDSCGALLQIRRLKKPMGDGLISTHAVHIHQLNTSNWTWSTVKRLEDQALFLGDNHSMSLSTSSFPCCKPNCIYFTDDANFMYRGEVNGPQDLGVFNLEDGSFQPHYVAEINILPPIWIEPTLQIQNIL